MKRVIRMHFLVSDCGNLSFVHKIRKLLEERYLLDENTRADYLLVSGYRPDAYDYDCIKIFVAQDMECPDFNVIDYAIGIEEINFSDRYFRYTGDDQMLKDYLRKIIDQPIVRASRCAKYGWNKEENRIMRMKLAFVRDLEKHEKDIS